ncbi:methylaspartate mutase subunit S [Halobacteriales archaeon SW_7_68_16]|nr:MAG: methylaspartate mutase subunit S [Halobacteriales archaeon SW_7_68_16]
MSCSQPSVVVGTIGSDAHAVGITLLEHALKEAGFEVRNLGAQTPQEAFVTATDERDADAVLVSSLYGHAEQDCEGLHERLADAGLDPLTYIGGNLAVGQTDFEAVRRRFRELGFDRVFDADTDFDDVVAALQAEFDVGESDAETETDRARVRS